MIEQQWYAVIDAAKVTTTPVGIVRFGRHWVLWRDARGAVRCLPDRCSHRGAPLSRGKIVDGTLECPYHGLRFDGNGRCVRIPAHGPDGKIPQTMHLGPAAVREAHGFVWLWNGAVEPSLPPLPWFEEIEQPHEETHTWSFVWKARFELVIEAFLDAHHIPFLHGHVLKGHGPVMSPFESHAEGDTIITRGAYAAKRGDDGTRRYEFRIRFPATAHLKFSPHGSILYIAAPIDAGSTWVSVRYYHGVKGWRWFRRLVSWAAGYFDYLKVHPDDQWVLEAIEERHAEGRSHLIYADRPIALWHKYRDSIDARRTQVATSPEDATETG